MTLQNHGLCDKSVDFRSDMEHHNKQIGYAIDSLVRIGYGVSNGLR